MDVVSERVAESEVQATREQIHSLSRVAQARPCHSAAMPYLTFAPHVITLSAQSVRNTSELAQLVQRLELQYSAFKSVSLHIVGFAHDTGSEASNHSASKQLASEVQRLIQAQTGSFRPVTAEGRGSKEQSNVRGQPASYVEIGITVESH